MKFFIPASKTDEESNEVFESIRKFAELTMGWKVTNRKIFKIKYRHNSKDYTAEVGKDDPISREPVIAILESETYLICTPSRGVIRDMPILVGKKEAYSIEDFD
jgi:hypothetical protein